MVADAFDIYKAFYFLAATIVAANLMVFFLPSGKAAHAKAVATS